MAQEIGVFKNIEHAPEVTPEVACSICGEKKDKREVKVRNIGPLTFVACLDCLARLEDWLDD